MLDLPQLWESRVSYPRRQEYRRLSRADGCGGKRNRGAARARRRERGGPSLAGAAAFVRSVLVSRRGIGLFLLGAAASAALGGRGAARAHDARAEGWRVRHSLRWSGRGDIDSVAIAPGGVAFAIEVKTSRYEDRHLVTCGSRRRGCGVSGEGGAGMAPCPCCVWLAAAGSSAGRTACWSSRSIASFRRCTRRVIRSRAWRCRSKPSA